MIDSCMVTAMNEIMSRDNYFYFGYIREKESNRKYQFKLMVESWTRRRQDLSRFH
jgi:hypothetical protein